LTSKKNDAATNTHNDCSYIPELLSFQIINNSPTFDKIEENMWGKSPMSSSKDAPSPHNYGNSKLREEEHQISKLNTERRIGGGFMINPQHVWLSF
jgi:hypothetical protein